MPEATSSADSSRQAKTLDIMQPKSRRWQCIYLWWNSLRAVSFLSTIARWTIAVIGIVVLVLGMRQSQLQDKAKAAEKAATDAEKQESHSQQSKLEQQGTVLASDLERVKAAAAAEKAKAEAEKAALNQEIAKLKPKPLKDRILANLAANDSRIVRPMKQGQNTTKILTSPSRAVELQRLCEEDRDGVYLKKVELHGTLTDNHGQHQFVDIVFGNQLADWPGR